MTNRREWMFTYLAESLIQPIVAKIAYHDERIAFWQNELVTAERDLRERGVEFRNQPVTGGNRMDVVLDPARQQRVVEARGKITEHTHNRDDYAAYRRAVELNPNVRLQLDVDDIKFFGLGFVHEEAG